MKKRCTKCKKYKNESEFYLDSRYNKLRSHCKSCCSDANRLWWKKSKDKIRHVRQQYEKDTQYSKRYRTTIEGRYNLLKGSAKRRAIDFTLSKEEFALLWAQPCTYCGDELDITRLDRVDNNQGYIAGNVVQCCVRCNTWKSNLPIEDFLARCALIVAKINKIKREIQDAKCVSS